MKRKRITALSEAATEKMLGGHAAYCSFWTEFNLLGLEVIFYNNKTCLAFGMSDAGIEVYQMPSATLVASITTLGAPGAAAAIHRSLTSQTGREIKTHQLVSKHPPARVLWAFSVHQLQGEQERLYDNCFENGDGELVGKAVGYLDKKHGKSKPISWKMTLGIDALAAST